jgi:hypothetical protein
MATSLPLARALPNAYWVDLGPKGFHFELASAGVPSDPPDADPHVRRIRLWVRRSSRAAL